MTRARRQPCRPCGPRAWRASTKTGWNWTIGAALCPPLPPTSPTLLPIAKEPDRAPRSFQNKEQKQREPGTSSVPPRTTARLHTSRRGGGRIYLQTLAVRATERRQTEADAAAGMLRAGGDRANRNCSPPPPLLPVDSPVSAAEYGGGGNRSSLEVRMRRRSVPLVPSSPRLELEGWTEARRSPTSLPLPSQFPSPARAIPLPLRFITALFRQAHWAFGPTRPMW